MAWWEQNSQAAQDSETEKVLRASMESGIIEPLTNRHFAPEEITWNRENYRETGLAGGLSSRLRGTLFALETCVPELDKYNSKIFATEGLTEFALLMRGRFAKFIGAEYAINRQEKEALYPIPHQDLTKLTFASGLFDLVITNEVLEHVPRLDAALKEIHRVLRPGGWHIGTCPLAFMQHQSILKAKLRFGRLVHLMEPEFHGNPMRPQDGSLVFEIPGWDILDRARAVGFKDAFWKLIRSERHGIASNLCGGVLVLCLKR
ncbi:hypothetical protein GCM10007301_35180 [Azorhizobium oxalatiphilum]|uniref:Methyltransferase type 11 domain-containing protein n=2 Tax=Azorhizobium oxalatiphilum TaxID=980631 RepID=A0A917C4X7_9HYPH|nr:hypothetical protein GCM10007301_35180 [Azorhizobium oxalatiphilum]